ncbi:MAG: TldD/PmbA family protein [Cyanophyceae cyanobacterium]
MSADLEQLLELAFKAGAEYAEVYQVRSHSRPVFFESNRLKQLESSRSEGVALRVWREGCPGLAVAYGLVEPRAIVEKAIALSALNAPETVEIDSGRTEIYPDTGETVPVEELVAVGSSAIEQIRDVYPESVCSAELECEQETTILLNSQGLHCQYTTTSLSYFIGAEWIRGEDFLGVYDGDSVRGQPDPTPVIQHILQRLDWANSQATPPAGHIPVLWTTNAATMLWETVAEALSGKRVGEGSSPWSNKQGQLVLDSSLTLSQQPQQGFAPCPFDDEGTPTHYLTLINQGKLEQFYTDRTTAKFLNTHSTGNGFRSSLTCYPTPELVNLLVEPGQGMLLELVAQLDEGLIVDQILGGGADISGNFSVNVDLGYRVQNGEIVGRVKDTMVDGNVYTALKQVALLGSDRRWQGSTCTPSVLVEGLSVISA